MPNFQRFTDNQGFFYIFDVRDYDLTSLTLTEAVFELKDSVTHDPGREAFKVTFTFANAKDAEVLTGPNASGTTLLDGGRVFTGGKLVKIQYWNEADAKIAELSDFEFDLPHLGFRYADDPSLWQLFEAITSDATTYSGTKEYDDIVTFGGDDKIKAGGSNDFVSDGGGKDIYDGGGGNWDVLSYVDVFWRPAWGDSGISVNLSAKNNKDYVIGYDGQKDSVKNFEIIRGTFRDDKFVGDSKDNAFSGYQGRDFFNGKGGFDVIEYGGDASRGASDGIIVDLRSGVARDGSGDYDTFKNIEGVEGTRFADTFFNAKQLGIYFNGFEGDDTFNLHNGSGYIAIDGGNNTFNISGKNFYYEIDNFVFFDDQVAVDDFTDSQWSLDTSSDGDGRIIFDDSAGKVSVIEFEGLSQSDLQDQIDGSGIESIVSFLAAGDLDLAPALADPGGRSSEGSFKGKFQWFDGNQGVYRLRNFNEAEITEIGYMPEIDMEGIRLKYTGDYERTRDWDIAILGIENEEWHEYETGGASTEGGWFDSGTYSGGKITSITFYNDLGFKIMEATGLAVDLAWFSAYYAREPDLWELWDAMTAYGGTFTGSNYGGGPDSDWSGEDIKTGPGDDVVDAKAGNDYIEDGGGKDKYNGGSGYDEISYEATFYNLPLAKKGIVARLDKGYIDGPDGIRDTIKNIEDVRGTPLKDKFYGDGNDNFFQGRGGADFFDGKGGRDQVSYRNDVWDGGTQGIIANMGQGTVVDGFGKTDTLKNIERIEGTNTDDTYKDSSGDDYFRARDGFDVITFSKGNDEARLDNDGDMDTLIFQGNNFGDDFVRGFDKGIDKIDIKKASFAELTLLIEDGDTTVEWNGNSIYFRDVELDSDDFI